MRKDDNDMSDTLKSTSLYDETTPVLIVGGGLVGLSTSLFLSWHGIHSLLVERHPSTAIHPRAIGMTPARWSCSVLSGSWRRFERSNLLSLRQATSCWWRAWWARCLTIYRTRQSWATSLSALCQAVPLLRMCWSRCCAHGPSGSGGVWASGPNWWHLSRMRRASRPRSANGQARARARFAPSFWWRLTAATAGFVKSSASASMEQRACFIASV